MSWELYQGDCLNILPNIDNESVDMILCDLPYGITNCKWDSVVNLEKLWEQYKRIIKQNGAIVLTACQPFTTTLISSNLQMFKYSWVWEKSKATGFLNAKKRPLVAHEDILIFSNGQTIYNPQFTQGSPYDKGIRKQQTFNDVYGKFDRVQVKSEGMRYPRSVQYFKTAESEGKTFHKTQKPLSLFEYLIHTYTNHGDTVLDNCAGSGTTGIAALKSGRSSILIEQEPKYCDIIRKRMSEITMNCCG